jgi:hypothetical protein
MAFKIQPSQLSGSAGLVPSVMNLPVEATQVFEKGTPVTLVSGEIEEHPLGATVIDLYGFSLESGFRDPTSNLPLATVNEAAIAKADRNTAFVSKAWDGAAIEEDLSAVNVGDQYGLVKDGNDFYVDLSDVVNVMVQITKIDNDLTQSGIASVLWFKVLESALQEP